MNLCERIQVLAHGKPHLRGHARLRSRLVRVSGRSISAMPEAAKAKLAAAPVLRGDRPQRQLWRGLGAAGRKPACATGRGGGACLAPTAPARAPRCAQFRDWPPAHRRDSFPRPAHRRLAAVADRAARCCAFARRAQAPVRFPDRGGEPAAGCRRSCGPERHRRRPRPRLRPLSPSSPSEAASRRRRFQAASSRWWRSAAR